jgi:DNA mismatch repair protein MutL
MSKIRVLPDSLANKIAAGEVVERPASVVKELLENALDAGARKINIEVESGGKRLIRIVDDGEGMTRDDAIIAFERHATSKLRTAEDLETITTLGFRGEALPSIAAVSKLFLRTKTANDIEGTEVEFNGGKLVNVRDIAWPGGTEIEVKDLFFNMPARRKFLKSDATESFHITNLVQHYALANHELAILLINNGRDSIRVANVASLKDRAYQILGGGLLKKLLDVKNEANGLTIEGFVSNPQEQRSSRDAQYLFVNHRFVKDQLITRALTEAYRSMMPSGTYPAAVLFIELPPDEVDVNVHPAKTEVRFLHETAIFSFVRDSIAQSLKATQTITRFPGTYKDAKSTEERLKTDAPRWQNIPTWSQRTFNPVEALPGNSRQQPPASAQSNSFPAKSDPMSVNLRQANTGMPDLRNQPEARQQPETDNEVLLKAEANLRRELLEDLQANVSPSAESNASNDLTSNESDVGASNAGGAFFTEEAGSSPFAEESGDNSFAKESISNSNHLGLSEETGERHSAVESQALHQNENLLLKTNRNSLALEDGAVSLGDAGDELTIAASTENQQARARQVATQEPATSYWHGIKPMGQIRDSYIVATDDEGLLLFDQHVVHERILFEQIRDGKMSRAMQIQPLLIPETLDLSPAEVEAFNVVKDELEHMGIETMELSGRTIAIKTSPAGVSSNDVVAIVQQLLSAVERERRTFTIETIRDEIAASLACKAAIKVNMPLTDEKMQWLIDELMKTQNPMTCPHGRPIIMRFDLRDIERGFKRPV